MKQLNSRADLEMLRGTPAFEDAMRDIYGSMVGWTLVEGAWEQTEDVSVLARLDFTKSAFMAEIASFQFPAPSPPAPPPLVNTFADLKPYQFWGAVRATGRDTDLANWAASIEDPQQRGIASAMLEFSLEFRRDHPLIEAARLHLEMSETELNDLWLWALTL